MTAYANHAAVDIAQWVSLELFASDVLDSSDYSNIGGFVSINPVFPIQQVPEMNNVLGERAFLVYDFMPLKFRNDMYEAIRETMTFTVYSTSYAIILEIQNFLVDLFRRLDSSAADINKKLIDQQISTENRFLFIEMADALPPDPAKDEGGRYGATVSIEYEYVRTRVKSDAYRGSGAGRFVL